MAPCSSIRIVLADDERAELEHLGRSLVTPHRTVVRAQVILSVADGKTISATARAVGRQRRIVRKWAERFVRKRLRGLDDAPRSGRPARFSPRSGHPSGQARLRAT
jgi:hypothetical protein